MRIFLFTDIMCYAKSSNEYMGQIKLANTWVRDVPSEYGKSVSSLMPPLTVSSVFLGSSDSLHPTQGIISMCIHQT